MASMMRAVFADGKGSVELAPTPRPEPKEGRVLVQMTHGLISSGTETNMIRVANGWTKEEIREKDFRLGYCTAGVVVHSDIDGLYMGDRVACYGGPYVSHSEFLSLPRRLVCTIPDNLSSEEAAFMGLGAIGMHGFRLGKAGLGDIAVVQGAGIIGNLTAQCALAAGCRVIASDLSLERLKVLLECAGVGRDLAVVSADKLDEEAGNQSNNQGADTVYIAVATKSSVPMHQAVRIVRAGGNIVIVGVVEVSVPREMLFYREATITASRAGGPGRYDPIYENDGIDYPIQYVRWTEGRNLAEVMRLLARRTINVKPLIANRFSIKNVVDAYTAVQEGGLNGAAILEWQA